MLNLVVRTPAETERKLLGDPDSYATTILTIVADEFGTECFDWHPSALAESIEKRWNVRMPHGNFDRLMTGIMLKTTDLFRTSVDHFIAGCNALGGSSVSFGTFDPADVLECSWGVVESTLLDPPDDPNQEMFSDSIRRYVGVALKEEGFIRPPAVLKMALDADWSNDVGSTFADDPEMFSGIWQAQHDKTGEIDRILKEELQEMLGQLQSLQPRHGSVRELAQQIRQFLKI